MNIYGEELLGLTDGINTVYSTQYTIDTVEEIRVGGTPLMPNEYTIDGNRIILNTPIEGDQPFIDYLGLENISAENVPDTLTVQDVLDEVIDIIGLKAFDNKAYKESVAIKRIGSLLEEFEIEESLEEKTSSYTFTKSEDVSVGNFVRNDLINTSNIGNFAPRFGTIYLDGVLVPYSTRTNSAITLNEPINFKQDSNSLISFGYKIPSAVQGITEIRVGGFSLKRIDFDKWSPNQLNTYTQKDGYLFLGDRAQYNVTIFFTKTQEKRDDVSSLLSNIPHSFCDVFALYASYNMMRNREDDRWQITEEAYKKRRRKLNAYVLRHIKGGVEDPIFKGQLNRI